MEKQIVIGILALLGGWNAPMKIGQNVQVEINNQWVDAVIVDDGLGKKKISVILDDDDTLQVQKVAIEKAKPCSKYEWPFEGQLGERINQQQLC